MAKIYTKVGDKGQTSLVGGQKVEKDDPRLEAYGAVDELNAALGLAVVVLADAATNPSKSACAWSEGIADQLSALASELRTLQHRLFNLGSLLAAIPADCEKYKLTPITEEYIEWLEERIDAAWAPLPSLKNFILPGGSEAAARLHLARTIARRAERAVVHLGRDVPDLALPFLNRLSDYLFAVARYANHLVGVEETVWRQCI